jgi:hydrogenase maturation factor
MNLNDGAITCARYAFAPNFCHYCGPETEGEFSQYVAASFSDGKLVEHLTKFETLYPYLKSSALANTIADPLDPRVVEAYWIGNQLLNAVTPQQTFDSLDVGQNLRKRLDEKSKRWLFPKIDKQAKLHHSFHVFNIFTRTGHRTVAHTTDTMDQCRIGWGRVIAKLPISNNQFPITKNITLKSQRLVYKEGTLQFEACEREVINPVDGLTLKVGDWVSFHWGFVCEKITAVQMKRLEKLTLFHLKLASETL